MRGVVWPIAGIAALVGGAFCTVRYLRATPPPVPAPTPLPAAPTVAPVGGWSPPSAPPATLDAAATIDRARAALADYGRRTVDELLADRRALDELQFSADATPQRTDVDRLKRDLDHALVRRFREDAAAFVALPTTDVHAGLARYAAAEDYARKAVETAHQTHDKADEAEYADIYKSLLVESDAYSAKVLTPAFIDAVPWRDLLVDGSKWSRSSNVPGFSFDLQNGVARCNPPSAGSGQEGVFAVLDQKTDHLRHFVLEMEFQVDGLATVYFHVAPPPMPPNSTQSHAFDLTSRGDGGLSVAEKYAMHVEYVGSRLVIKFPDHDVQAYEPDPSWVKRRVGGIAIRIPEGTHLSITRMRIKELR